MAALTGQVGAEARWSCQLSPWKSSGPCMAGLLSDLLSCRKHSDSIMARCEATDLCFSSLTCLSPALAAAGRGWKSNALDSTPLLVGRDFSSHDSNPAAAVALSDLRSFRLLWRRSLLAARQSRRKAVGIWTCGTNRASMWQVGAIRFVCSCNPTTRGLWSRYLMGCRAQRSPRRGGGMYPSRLNSWLPQDGHVLFSKLKAAAKLSTLTECVA
jgi:hypothetical protein